MGRHGKMDGHDSADGLHTNDSVVAVFLCGFVILHAVMKPIMATAIAPTAPVTVPVPVPAPEAKPNPARRGTMIRTIKMDFDQSGDLSTLVSRLIVQQRWAYNMAVEKTLKDPVITGFDLYNKLTKWRSENRWLDGPVLVQRAGLAQGREAVLKFLESSATKKNNRIMWKNLSRKDREKEGLQDIDTTANLSQNKWSGKRNRWSHADDLFRDVIRN